jgi:hypothetical protein
MSRTPPAPGEGIAHACAYASNVTRKPDGKFLAKRSMSGKRKWEKWEKIQREIARIAISQWEDGKRTIADLSRAIEELFVETKQPGEGILAVARGLARQWKAKGRPLLEGVESERLALLVALVVALQRASKQEELAEKFRRLFPELEEAEGQSPHVQAVREASSEASMPACKEQASSRTQRHEEKRRRCHRSLFGSIEYQFGGKGEAERGKSLMGLSGLPYEPKCLDDILLGESVNMRRLEDLFFGIGRKRLAKLVDHEDKNRGKYGSRALGEIMKVLLKEKPRKRRKRRAPGRPRQEPWLNDADLRTRVFCAIEKRIVSIGKELLLSIDQDKATDQDKALRWWKEIAEPSVEIVR